MMGILRGFDLSGQTAIVTGAGTGLGREMALALAEAGCDIVGVARRAGPLDEVGEEIRARGRRFVAYPGIDVTVPAQIDAMLRLAIDAMGEVSILVNNAGGGSGVEKSTADLTDDDWRDGIELNLSAAFYCSRAVIPHMVDRGGGRIVNVSSVQGSRIRGGHPDLVYGVAKAGLNQLTKALAVAYARNGIRVTGIAPGPFPKDPLIFDDARLQAVGPLYPTGRVGFLHEIGPLAVFLASPGSEYLSGQTLFIDGGSIAAGLTPAGVAPRSTM